MKSHDSTSLKWGVVWSKWGTIGRFLPVAVLATSHVWPDVNLRGLC